MIMLIACLLTYTSIIFCERVMDHITLEMEFGFGLVASHIISLYIFLLRL